jgi:hypothetical protein
MFADDRAIRYIRGVLENANRERSVTSRATGYALLPATIKDEREDSRIAGNFFQQNYAFMNVTAFAGFEFCYV